MGTTVEARVRAIRRFEWRRSRLFLRSYSHTPFSSLRVNPPVMPAGSRYAGQPIDTSRSRPVVIRDRIGKRTGEPERLVVDHVYHKGAFWTAVIPCDGVNEVFAQAYNFSSPRTKRGPEGKEILFDRHGMPKRRLPILNHVQARFTFRSGFAIDLHPLGDEQLASPLHSVSDICYSVEAAGPTGYAFSLRNTLFGHLVSVHRITSMHEMVFERLVTEDQYLLESPPLPLSAEQKEELLLTALRRSHDAGLKESYYLFRTFWTNNCTSNALQILDSVVDYPLFQRLASRLYRLPLNPRLYLRLRGMDSDPTHRKLVRDEFLDFINDPETQARKRAFLAERQASSELD